jgi:DNA-binding response OmpR family regulator
MTRVMIVDDDRRTRQILAFFLQLHGYETDEAGNGLQAVERFLAHPCSAVLINVDMPDMAGWEACERLRQRSQVPIVIMSSDGHPSIRGRALLWGVNAFLVKPTRLGCLLDWIQIVAWNGSPGLTGPLPSLERSRQKSAPRPWGGLT